MQSRLDEVRRSFPPLGGQNADLDLTSHAKMYEMSQKNQTLHAIISVNQAALAATADQLDAMQNGSAQRALRVCRNTIDDLAKVRQISLELLVDIQSLHERKMAHQQRIALDQEEQQHLTLAGLRAEYADQLALEASKQIEQMRYTRAINREQEAKIANLSSELFAKSKALDELGASNHRKERRAVEIDAATQTLWDDNLKRSDSDLPNQFDASDVRRAKSLDFDDFVQVDDPDRLEGAEIKSPQRDVAAAVSQKKRSLKTTLDLLEQASSWLK